MNDDATLPDTDTPPPTTPSIAQRYKLDAVIGRGGMGEVRLARDTQIERDVAVKLMRSSTDDKDLVARFFREAKVQGRLDHPAIVPVHDLGFDQEGQPYFVMKRLAGTTLAEVLEKKSQPLRTLLGRLVDVCLAIDFAHKRGVVHRDLKPANIMLGDYGEAYVLDWGLARIVGDDVTMRSVGSLSGEDGQTQAGALLGTPGYMSPEQARGEDIDQRTDVFALGCLLFEILAGSPALPRGLGAIEQTISAEEHRPSKRAEVPLELDDLCAQATAAERTLRPTARELGDGIQRYLDGDRDIEARRDLASQHVRAAQAALAEDTEESRGVAMREAGRAFVLDKTNTSAPAIIASLTLEAPKKIPVEALEAAELERAKTRRRAFYWGALSYVGMSGAVVLLFAFRVKHAWPILLTIALTMSMAASLGWMSRRLQPARSWWLLWVTFLNMSVLIASSYIFGPLLILPIFVCGSLAVYLMTPTRWNPVIIVAAHATAITVPVATELVGLTPGTFSIDQTGRVLLAPYAVDIPPWGMALVMIVAIIIHFVNTTILALSQRNSQEQALDKVHAQSWHLKQLLPDVRADDERSK